MQYKVGDIVLLNLGFSIYLVRIENLDVGELLGGINILAIDIANNRVTNFEYVMKHYFSLRNILISPPDISPELLYQLADYNIRYMALENTLEQQNIKTLLYSES